MIDKVKLDEAMSKIKSDCDDIANDDSAAADFKDYAKGYKQGAEALYVAAMKCEEGT